MTFSSAFNSTEELLQIARGAITAGHRATAARMVNRVLESEPDNKEAWRLLAECMPDPDSRHRCLVKAGDAPARVEKTDYATERYTVPPASRVELPPPPPEAEPEPVILPHRKYPTSSRAEAPSRKPPAGKLPQTRTARTRKTDPKNSRKRKSSGGLFLFILFLALLAGGYLYFKPDLNLDRLTSLLFPTSLADEAVADLIPSEPMLEPTPVPEEIPDANQPGEDAVSDGAAWEEKVIQIGQSVGGRPIEVYQFGSGETQRLVVAGMHGGNEYNTIDLADELIAHIRANPEIIPPEKTLFILRNLNPDGEARGHNFDGRTNENGVDLNRNWDSHWKIDWNRDNCWIYRPVTGGPFPASEPETQALVNFINNNHIDGIINYHSAALGIFPGGQPYEELSSRLSETIHDATGYPYPPIDIGCEYTGMFTDWAADHGIPAVDVELTNHRDTDFDENLKAVNALLAWNPYAAPKSLPGVKPGSETLEGSDESVSPLATVGKKLTDIAFDAYGLLMSRFEER